MLFSIKMLDTIVLYMPFLILISVNSIVLKELFGSTMMVLQDYANVSVYTCKYIRFKKMRDYVFGIYAYHNAKM